MLWNKNFPSLIPELKSLIMQNRISQHLWKAAWERYVIFFHISSFSQALIFLIDTALGQNKNIKDKHVVNVMIRYRKSIAGAAMWWSDVQHRFSAPRTQQQLKSYKNTVHLQKEPQFLFSQAQKQTLWNYEKKVLQKDQTSLEEGDSQMIQHLTWLFYTTTLRDVQMNIIRSGRRLSPTNTRTTPGDSAPRGRGVLTPPQTLTEQVT